MAENLWNDGDLLFCPLGGSGEIGMNLNLFYCDGQWLMVDCGMTFGEDGLPGVDLVFPDTAFIEERRDRLTALVLTHGHEDHIGAVPYLWPRLRCPIYATPFTAELVRGKLEEAGIESDVDLRVVPVGGALETGCFKVRYVPLAHSIPEGHGLRIDTPRGTIFHTGDWKLDIEPQIGDPSTPTELEAIGRDGVLAMTGDSTNVFNATESGSEQAVKDSLMELVGTLGGRVVITTFASNVARLKTVGAVAEAHGRRIVLAGRSMRRVVEAARATGYLEGWPETVPEDDADSLPAERTLILCTGAQGEPRAALSRIASGDHRAIALEAGDSVIFSSKIIPGNELAIARLMNKLALADIDVITERDAFVHVSGHPGRAELARMYEWIRPEIAIPVHGEARHLRHHARFARALGVPQALAPKNGDIIRLAPGPAEVIDRAPAGRLVLDGSYILPLDNEALAARRRILVNGFAAIVVLADEAGELAGEPEVIAHGIPALEAGGEAEAALIKHIERTVGRMKANLRAHDADLGEQVRIEARRFLRRHSDKNPVVDVRVVRLEEEFV